MSIVQQITKVSKALASSAASSAVSKGHERYFSSWETADILRQFASSGQSPLATLNDMNSQEIEAVKAHLLDDIERDKRTLERLEQSQSALDLLNNFMTTG